MKISFQILFLLLFFIADRFLKKIALRGRFFLFKNYNLIFGSPFKWLYWPFFVLFLFVIGWFLIKFFKKRNLLFFAFGLIFISGFSNLLDRFFLGYVIDYLNFGRLGIFNLADLGIWLGLAMVVVDTIYKKVKI